MQHVCSYVCALLCLQEAFPILLVRCRTILQQFAAEQRRQAPADADPVLLGQTICTLQARATLLMAIPCLRLKITGTIIR